MLNEDWSSGVKDLTIERTKSRFEVSAEINMF